MESIFVVKHKTTVTTAAVTALVCSRDFSSTAKTTTMSATQTIRQRQIRPILLRTTHWYSLHIASEECTVRTHSDVALNLT